MTREEAHRFLKRPKQSTDVTWEVTPRFDLRVILYTARDLKQAFWRAGFKIANVRSLNLLSGIVPLPIQQSKHIGTLLRKTVAFLLKLDHKCFGKMPGLRWFGGNVYLILEKR
jgi:hypothetical protein